MHSPYEEHLEAAYRILRYLKNSLEKGLFFEKNEQRGIETYTDADWAGSTLDRRSTSGYYTFVWGNLVTWRSKKQNEVARSSAEAEYRSMAQGICEMIWLKRILEELRRPVIMPMKLYCDNKAAINIAHNPVQHDRTKHVEIDRHFIKEKIEAGAICMPFVPTSQQVADVLTKGLFRPNFEFLISKEMFPSHVKIYVQNDAVAALASGTLGKLHGCVLVAGTGCIALGFSEDGKEARAAGGGPILGDWGSGYGIAAQALTAVIRAYDGRGSPTMLTSRILKALGLSSPEEIIGWTYTDQSWARIAALVPEVVSCAEDGDQIAHEILVDAVNELAIAVKAVIERLCLCGEDRSGSFPVVMVGGVLESNKSWDIGKEVIKYIQKLYPGAHPIRPKVEPAIGAALLACNFLMKESQRNKHG
ncbi:hypothetical protein L484_026004 [Morus notabilis]|uniref:N-acetyl-D-glucosamine kinase n=1 Tax=Morus notabilis TaxID=981085 RepID=W9R7S4_9ROSA|nr:hypothetical protein L484_026004 [Morus notabilis]